MYGKDSVMKEMNAIKKMTLSAMFLALGMVLPFFTGQIPQIGAMLCPMHIPVLLCGFLCGGNWGFIVGLILPVLRSMLFSMPPMFPQAVCMAVELAMYGLVSGWLHTRLPKKTWSVYMALIGAMIIGRVFWGMAMFACFGLTGDSFGLAAFWAGAVVNAIPGIVLQVVLVPIIVLAVKRGQKQE